MSTLQAERLYLDLSLAVTVTCTFGEDTSHTMACRLIKTHIHQKLHATVLATILESPVMLDNSPTRTILRLAMALIRLPCRVHLTAHAYPAICSPRLELNHTTQTLAQLSYALPFRSSSPLSPLLSHKAFSPLRPHPSIARKDIR